MAAVGRSVVEACPATGCELEEELAPAGEQLKGLTSGDEIRGVQEQVQRDVTRWGVRTAEHLRAKADEVKELMLMLARTAEGVGDRDQRYCKQFSGLTADLRTVADLEDITQMRGSVLKKAAELKTCVDAMAEDGRQSLEAMREKISDYERRLREAEELAQRDPLTGLANRRGLEARMEWWARQQRTFCAVMIDLNHFKELNDRHGHLAGDELLRQFAQELSSRVREEDLVGRWGGDEFLVVVRRERSATERLVERIREWAFGEYALRTGRSREPLRVQVEAAVGVAEWTQGIAVEEVVRLADAAMYAEKRGERRRMPA
ncbi:MAG TPA: GGDEF domain-containing protein [Acidobacteriaceae bacterium]|nr:GGDEF domain-containing protein [Acidobacteriaceae bacterium]